MQSSKDAEILTANENQSPNMDDIPEIEKKVEQADQVEKVASAEEVKEPKEDDSSSSEEEKLTPAE